MKKMIIRGLFAEFTYMWSVGALPPYFTDNREYTIVY